MERRNVFERVVLPALVLLGIMALSINMYDAARLVENITTDLPRGVAFLHLEFD